MFDATVIKLNICKTDTNLKENSFSFIALQFKIKYFIKVYCFDYQLMDKKRMDPQGRRKENRRFRTLTSNFFSYSNFRESKQNNRIVRSKNESKYVPVYDLSNFLVLLPLLVSTDEANPL